MKLSGTARAQWMAGRSLMPAEREFLYAYFGEALDLEPIRLAASLGARSWSPFGPRISLVKRHFHERSAARLVRLDDPVAASVFAHEALHVWQRQWGRRVTWEAIPLQAGYVLGRRDPYAYERTDDPARMLEQFLAANVERQAKIFEDYVARQCAGADVYAYRAVAEHVRTSARDQGSRPSSPADVASPGPLVSTR